MRGSSPRMTVSHLMALVVICPRRSDTTHESQTMTKLAIVMATELVAMAYIVKSLIEDSIAPKQQLGQRPLLEKVPSILIAPAFASASPCNPPTS
jgi:hypothetical protein